MRTFIKGMGMYLPEKTYESEEIEEMAGFSRLGVKKGLVRMLTGCERRHYAAETEWCSDVAAKARAEAVRDAGLASDDIDAVIFGAITRDFAEPGTVNRVIDILGISDCYGFDIFNACNAFIGGVDLADSLIKTGKAGNVLVVCGEIQIMEMENIIFKELYLKSEYELLQNTQKKLKAANVIAKDPGNVFTRFVIDKGSADNVKIGDIILQGYFDENSKVIEAVLGKVTEVGLN